MNFKALLALSTSAQVVALLTIICNYKAGGIPIPEPVPAPVPVPGPGGVSQVGFSIYRNKQEYDAARNNDKVIVTYAVSHPTNTRSGSQGNLNSGADISRNYYDYTQHFGNHQQHQKQIESFRQEQQQQQQQQQQRRTGVSSASNYYGSQPKPKVGVTRIAPAPAQASVRVPGSEPTAFYKPTNQAPTFLVASNNKPAAPRQQQNRPQSGTITTGNTNKNNNASPAGSQVYFANNYLQKPSTNTISNPSDLLRQQQLVALAKIAKSKNGKLSEALDLNEALDASYPVKYY